MSDLAKRLNADCSSISGSQCNAMRREAAAELARLHKLIDSLNTDYSALQSLHDAGTAPYTAEIERLQARNAELGEEVERLRADEGRLDWLFCDLNDEDIVRKLTAISDAHAMGSLHGIRMGDFRAAIDAARAAAKHDAAIKEAGNG